MTEERPEDKAPEEQEGANLEFRDDGAKPEDAPELDAVEQEKQPQATLGSAATLESAATLAPAPEPPPSCCCKPCQEPGSPLVGAMDRIADEFRVFAGRAGAFDCVRGILTAVGLYAILAMGLLLAIEGFVETFRIKWYLFVGGLLAVVAALALHYCAAKFARVGKAIMDAETRRMTAGPLVDSLGTMALASALLCAACAVAIPIILRDSSWVWLFLLGAVESLCLAVLCLNPKETMNIEVVERGASDRETALSLLAFVVRVTLAAAPLLLGLGVLVCAAWLLTGMIVFWTRYNPAHMASATLFGVAYALLPLASYLLHLAYTLGVDFYNAVVSKDTGTQA